MAAGEGSRLRPLTERYAKPVLPIDGRPVVATLLRELAEAGVELVTLVTGHLAEQVEALACARGAFALEVRVVRQPEAVGSGDAVLRAVRGGATPPFLVSAADTLYVRGDAGRFADAFAASGAAGAISFRRDPPPGPGKPAVKVVGDLVELIIDRDPANPLSSAPLWALGPALAPYLEDLPGPPFELATAYQRAIDAGEPVAGIEIGKTRDLTRPLDLVEENFPYLGSL